MLPRFISPSAFASLTIFGDDSSCPPGGSVILDAGGISLYRLIRIAQFNSEVGRRWDSVYAGGLVSVWGLLRRRGLLQFGK